MLNVTMTVRGKTLSLPSVSPGDTGSLTDLKDNTLIIFGCNDDDDGALITRSVAGLHQDIGNLRVIDCFAAKPLAILSRAEQFDLEVLSSRGPMELHFEHAHG